MQKKWWKKPNKIIGTALITGVLALSTALLTVSCGSAESGPTQPGQYVNNRPVKGFYYQYEEKDIDVMKEMIIYIYNNNPIREKYDELGINWPAINRVELEWIKKPSESIPDEVFKEGATFDDPIERYNKLWREWRFLIYFEKNDAKTQTDLPSTYILFQDWTFSFTSQKYIDDVELWRTSATEGSGGWLFGGWDLGIKNYTWNAPLKFKNGPSDVLPKIFHLFYGYANAVDTWYTIKLNDKVKRQQYWDEMVKLSADYDSNYWDNVLPITE